MKLFFSLLYFLLYGTVLLYASPSSGLHTSLSLNSKYIQKFNFIHLKNSNIPYNDSLFPALKLKGEMLGIGGVSSSFGYGAYIRYQRAFFDLSDQEVSISGHILPIWGLNWGGMARLHLFAADPLQKLYLGGGIMYTSRGFSNKSTTTISHSDYTDETKFTEKYKISRISIPLLIGWDNDNWFVEAGISPEMNLRSVRIHKLKRSISGENAYNGGFSTQDRTRSKLADELLAKTKRGSGWVLAGGYRLEAYNAMLRAGLVISPRTLAYADNFRNATIFFQIVLPIEIPTFPNNH